MPEHVSYQGGTDRGVPLVSPGDRVQFCTDAFNFTTGAGTLFNAAVLPASGAWKRSQMFGVKSCRFVNLELFYTAAGSSSAAYPLVVPMYCTQLAQPAINDDVWLPYSVSDGLVTATALSGTLPTTGSGGWKGFTGGSSGPLMGYQTFLPLVVAPQRSITAADKLEQGLLLDVSHAQWFCLMAAEKGDTSHPGTLDAWLSAGA